MRLGISGMPPAGVEDTEFLDGLAAGGHRAYELAFVKGFPTVATIWERVARFGDLFSPLLDGAQRLEAAERALGIESSG